ncbi:hypothetical protein ACFVTY_09175 [Streptomyces sp. NPDC058067]|uniref:hypothetical protein n=1 Tax=Streptomyces sp. NPDC058067 TaxID=3346324 RepID=UPI0036E03A64
MTHMLPGQMNFLSALGQVSKQNRVRFAAHSSAYSPPLTNSSLLEAPLPKATTVGQLIHQLQALDPNLPVYLAVNPDWPFAHRIGSVLEDHPAFGDGAVYITEDGQQEVLCPGIRAQLDWSMA